MDTDIINDLRDRQEEEIEEEDIEALSLRDFAIHNGAEECEESLEEMNLHPKIIVDHRASSEFFEFLSDLSSETMSNAEDIIFCGKLVPFKQQPALTINFGTDQRDSRDRVKDKVTQKKLHARRSESCSELKIDRSFSAKSSSILMRNSRSLDYKKLRRDSSSSSRVSDVHQSKSLAKADGLELLKGSNSKRRWCLFMLGLVRLPPEMDLQDIKNRLSRRNPGTLFVAAGGCESAPVSQIDRKKYWGFLKVLSCRDYSSVAVTTSYGSILQNSNYSSMQLT